MEQAGAAGAPTPAEPGLHPGRATGAASSAAGLGASAAAAPRAAPAPAHAGAPGPPDGAPGASAAPSASASAMTCARRSARTDRLRAAAAGSASEAGIGLLFYPTLAPARRARAQARLIGERLPAGHGAHGRAAREGGIAGGIVLHMRHALPRGQACRVRRPLQLGDCLPRSAVTGGGLASGCECHARARGAVCGQRHGQRPPSLEAARQRRQGCAGLEAARAGAHGGAHAGTCIQSCPRSLLASRCKQP